MERFCWRRDPSQRLDLKHAKEMRSKGDCWLVAPLMVDHVVGNYTPSGRKQRIVGSVGTRTLVPLVVGQCWTEFLTFVGRVFS